MQRDKTAALVVSIVGVVAVVLAVATAQSDTGRIRGVVSSSTGALLQGASVAISRQGGTPRTTLTNVKAEFVFVGLDPGRYDVTASMTGFLIANASADVTPGSTVSLSLALQLSPLKDRFGAAVPSPP